MKSKTLLIAAATLAAGVMSSSAAVYSQNIVGYVNVAVTNGGQFTLLANPLDDGNGNYATNIFSLATAPLIKGSAILTWNYANAAYSTISVVGNSNTGTNWAANSGVQIPPGAGFFVKNGVSHTDASVVFTNTFVGTVPFTSGSSVTNPIPTGFQMYGSVLPEAGNVTIAGTPGGDVNFNYTPLIKGSKVLTWNSPNQAFTTLSLAGNSNTGTNWSSTVNIGVGQGFFIFNNGPATNVIQNSPF